MDETVFHENAVSPDSIEWNDELIKKMKKCNSSGNAICIFLLTKCEPMFYTKQDKGDEKKSK